MYIVGHEHAIATLYFQLKFGEPDDLQVPVPEPSLVEALISAVANGRMARWALNAIKLLSDSVPEVQSALSRVNSGSELFTALLAYARGEIDGFFGLIERAATANVELWQDPAIDALAAVDIEWHGHEDLLLTLLRIRQESLATPLLDA